MFGEYDDEPDESDESDDKDAYFEGSQESIKLI